MVLLTPSSPSLANETAHKCIQTSGHFHSFCIQTSSRDGRVLAQSRRFGGAAGPSPGWCLPRDAPGLIRQLLPDFQRKNRLFGAILTENQAKVRPGAATAPPGSRRPLAADRRLTLLTSPCPAASNRERCPAQGGSESGGLVGALCAGSRVPRGGLALIRRCPGKLFTVSARKTAKTREECKQFRESTVWPVLGAGSALGGPGRGRGGVFCWAWPPGRSQEGSCCRSLLGRCSS